jgi:hypothetical protein
MPTQIETHKPVIESFLLSTLDVPMRAALESKFNALPQEVRNSIAANYPTVSSNIERYCLRQMVREANGKLASQKRPGWYALLLQWAPALNSLNETVKTQATKELQNLNEQFDSKEATALLKKYKNNQDTTTADPHIITVCGIFGVIPANLK